MKRILIFSLNYYPRFIGGAEVAIKEITDRLSPEEFEFHLLTLRFDSELPKQEKIGNVIVHRIGPTRPHPTITDLGKPPLHYAKYWYQFAAAWHAHLLHQKYRFDGLWAMMAHSCGVPAGLFKLFHPSVPYLLTLQEGDPPQDIERTIRVVWPLFKQGFTRADRLQAISNFLLEWGKHMGFTGEEVLIPNGVDITRFAHQYSEQEISQMQKELGKKPGDVFLVTASRLVHKNGLDEVIRTLPKLPEHVSFLIYGIGPDESMLRELADSLGVGARVRFMGQMGHDQLPLALKASDIFIRPSRSEGMGNSFIEAMAASLPVIATQEGGISDFLFDAIRNPDKPTTGWAVDADVPEQIARAVNEIISNHEQTQKVVENASILVRESYDWNGVAAEMMSVFNGLY